MNLQVTVYRSVIFSILISLIIFPTLSGITLAYEDREIPEFFQKFSCKDTITLNKITHVNNHLANSKYVLLSGNVNFEDDKAVNLGIPRGYSVTLWVYQLNPFPIDYRLAYVDMAKTTSFDSFEFKIDENKLNDGKFVVYVFYGIPKQSMQESIMVGKDEFYIGITPEEFDNQKEKLMDGILGVSDIKELESEKAIKSNSIKLYNNCIV